MISRSLRRSFIHRSPVLLESEGWREHISYVKYLNCCTTALHKTVKDAKVARYSRFSLGGYHAQTVDVETGATVRLEKVPNDVSQY